jgi:precorrin-4 methylase
VAYRVSWPDQQIIRGTLATIAAEVRRAGIKRQALILVGPTLAPEGPETRSKLYDPYFSHGFRGEE